MELYSDTGPITIGGPDRGPGDDLRYGSVKLAPLPAAPSWYGLHDWPLSPWIGGADSRLTPLSYAQIFACQPWVFTAVMRILQWAIKVPLKTYRRDGDDKIRIRPEDHPLAAALEHPWEGASTYNLVASFLGSLLVHGNGTVQAHSGAREAIRFQPRDWRYQAPIKILDNVISGWESYEDDTKEVPITSQEMLHIAWWSPGGPIGISPLHSLGVTLEVEHRARMYARNSLRNMARPPSAITVDDKFLGLEPEERKAAIELARAEVTRTTSGANQGAPAILPTGLDWKQIGHTAVEVELIEQRKIDREEISATYQLSPVMIGILDHATYSNVSELRQMAYTDTLGPPLALIESAFNAQFVYGSLGLSDVFVEFDFGHVLRGDRLKEIQALREGIQTGIYTINEARSALNMPASGAEGADELYIPSNNLSPIPGSGSIQSERRGAPVPPE